MIEFENPVKGLAQPVFRSNPGFIEGGFTQGGAIEYILPNYEIKELSNVVIRNVPKGPGG